MVEDRFIELLTKQLSHEISEAEFKEFQEFLVADEANRKQYEVFKGFWEQKDKQESNSAKLFEKIISRIEVPEQATELAELPVAGKSRFMWPGIAAAILVVFGSIILFQLKTQLNGNFAADTVGLDSIVTKPQSRSVITLTDGTQVTLNSESTLKYPRSFSSKTREVYLSGEAFFDVYKDHEHPFIIHTGKMNIKVLGTAFNVKAYPGDFTSETTLIRGRIEVTLNNQQSDRIILKPDDKLILKNNQEVATEPQQNNTGTSDIKDKTSQYMLTKLTYLNSKDTTAVETSWLKNKLIFRNEDFVTLALRLQRWYGVNITINNEQVKQYRFDGVFENETLNQALAALQITEKFQYKIDKSTVLIY